MQSEYLLAIATLGLGHRHTVRLQHRQLWQRPTSIRSFHVSPTARDFHFDTHHFVQRLEREGLTRAQSEGIMASIADVIDESIRNLTQNMVSKAQQEKVAHLRSRISASVTHTALSNSSITRRKLTLPN